MASGGYEIAAGHHRIEAARRAGMTEADIFVGEFNDEAMVRIYARENAIQRGHRVNSIDGSVLSAVRFLAKQLLSGMSAEISRHGDKSLFENGEIIRYRARAFEEQRRDRPRPDRACLAGYAGDDP